jgi:hypothetical protein
MVETLKTVLGTLLLLFQSRSRLQVEILWRRGRDSNPRFVGPLHI